MEGKGTKVFPNSVPDISLKVVPEALLTIESINASKTHTIHRFSEASVRTTDLKPWFVAMGLAAIPK